MNLFGCKNSTIVIKGKVNAITIGSWNIIDRIILVLISAPS